MHHLKKFAFKLKLLWYVLTKWNEINHFIYVTDSLVRFQHLFFRHYTHRNRKIHNSNASKQNRIFLEQIQTFTITRIISKRKIKKTPYSHTNHDRYNYLKPISIPALNRPRNFTPKENRYENFPTQFSPEKCRQTPDLFTFTLIWTNMDFDERFIAIWPECEKARICGRLSNFGPQFQPPGPQFSGDFRELFPGFVAPLAGVFSRRPYPVTRGLYGVVAF